MSAEETMVCPVCVFHATNIRTDDLVGDCWNCGHPLRRHAAAARDLISPGLAYAVNPNALPFLAAADAGEAGE